MIGLGTDINRLGISMCLGVVVGLEREFNEKPAGLKTNVLICMGSTLFTLMSEHSLQNAGLRDFHIAAQIVTGIGFLGAGAIMKDGDRITGLTTAAVIWVVAAIGMAVAMGYYTVAEAATAGTLAIQLGLGQMDSMVDRLRQRYVFKILSRPDDRIIDSINRILISHKLKIIDHKTMKKDNMYYSEWRTAGSPEEQDLAASELLRSNDVIEVTF